MASTLDKFKREVIGSKGTIADYTSKISSNADFQRIKDLDVVLNSWRNILLTPVGSYDHDPEYGSELYKYVFEPADDYTASAIRDEITFRLALYDSRATITNVVVDYLPNERGFILQMNVKFGGKTGDLTVKLDEAVYLDFMEQTE